MKKLLLITLFSGAILSTAYAAQDVTTPQDPHFLKESQSIDSFAILPPPPMTDNIELLNDKAQYEAGKLIRDTPRGKLAWQDAHVSGNGVPNVFTEAFGMPVTEEKTPEIYQLVMKMRVDAGILGYPQRKKLL